MMLDIPQQSKLINQLQYRIIPSVYPPINFFEDLVDPSEMEILFEIENMTNPRLRQEAGNIFLVAPNDRVSGPGSSVVMAAFTHIGKASRFTDGSYGVYYAGLSLETAIKETVFHREIFYNATSEDPCEITMRLYQGKIMQSLHDIRSKKFAELHNPNEYSASQQFGNTIRSTSSWGLIYNSVRHQNNHCVAIFRPPAISKPREMSHFKYIWNGKKITEVLKIRSIQQF